MLVSPVPTVCILVKDCYDIDKIETIKAKIAKMPHFRFFISPQYTDEPKYDIYAVSDNPPQMLMEIHSSALYDDIEDIMVLSI